MKARARSAVVTLALLAAAAGALAVAWRVDRAGEAEKKRKESSDKLLSFDRAQVKEVVVEAKGGSVKLARAGEGWRITSPVSAAADRGTVDALLDRLATLTRRSEVAPAGGSLAPYGLAKPRARVTLVGAGGTQSLAIGDESSFDGSLFVQPTGGGVERVGGDVRWSLEKDLFDLRDKRVLPVEEKDVSRLEVSAPKLAYALERDGARWKVTSPFADRADASTLARVLGAVTGLRATRFVDAPAGDAPYGLDRPRYTVKLAGPGGAAHVLRLGAPAAPPRKEKKDAAAPRDLFARLDGTGPVAAVPESAVSGLDADAEALRDRTVLDFDRNAVAAVRLESGGAAIELQRKDPPDAGAESWMLTSPRAAPARSWRVSSLLYTLSSLQGTRIADETGKDPARYGLDHPARTVTLLGKDSQPLARLEVGREQGDKAFVRGGGRPRVYEIEKSRLSEIPASAEDLEEKAEKSTTAAKGG